MSPATRPAAGGSWRVLAAAWLFRARYPTRWRQAAIEAAAAAQRGEVVRAVLDWCRDGGGRTPSEVLAEARDAPDPAGPSPVVWVRPT